MESDLKNNISEDIPPPRPVVLLLIDGWGIAHSGEINAFTTASIPNFLELVQEYPVAVLNPGTGNLNERYVSIGQGLTQILADNGLKQLKIAETERFTAVSYFFNGRREDKVKGEKQKIISSSLASPMKAIMKETSQAIKSGDYDFIVSVIADVDIDVPKEGRDIREIIKEVDANIKKLSTEILEQKGVLIISAATGNAERIKNLNTGLLDKKMTNNPVPLIIIGEDFRDKNIGLIDPLSNDLSTLAPIGDLTNLAPTILKIMNLKKPLQMTSESLIV